MNFATAPVSHDHPVYYFTEAPPVFFGRTAWQIACTLLLPASTAALVYAVPVAATARDDLGGYPAVDPPYPQPADAPTSARHSGRRLTAFPLITLVAIAASRAIPT